MVESQSLTVNGIWGGVVPPPLLQDFFVKNIGILYAYDFLTLLLKFYYLTFKKNFKALAALESCHVTFFRQKANENLQFSRFLEHISESFLYFFMKFVSQ